MSINCGRTGHLAREYKNTALCAAHGVPLPIIGWTGLGAPGLGLGHPFGLPQAGARGRRRAGGKRGQFALFPNFLRIIWRRLRRLVSAVNRPYEPKAC